MKSHLHDHPETRFALLYVSGDGCWELLSQEPMPASQVFRRLPFEKLDRPAIPALMRSYHRIYAEVEDALLWELEDSYGRGTVAQNGPCSPAAAELGIDIVDHLGVNAAPARALPRAQRGLAAAGLAIT